MDESLAVRLRTFVEMRTPALLAGRVLLAVSGGADSIAMTAMLLEAGVIERTRAVVGHFDHRLRGVAASRRDLAAVQSLCRRFQLELVTGAWEAPRATEAAARNARYAFLMEAARSTAASVVATGHTSGDQVETVVMNVIRGAGLHGLRGIRPQAVMFGAATVVRPILCVSRSETRSFCEGHGLAFVDDETNADMRYLRNRVRCEVIPNLENSAPDARRRIIAIAEQATSAVASLERLAAGAILRSRHDEVVLSKAALAATPTLVRTTALRLAVDDLMGHCRDLEARHYMQIERALNARTGAAFQLPAGLVLHVERDSIVLRREVLAREHARGSAEAPAPVPLPFTGSFHGWNIQMTARALGAPCDVLIPPGAVLRTRRPGDRMRTQAGTRKLQDIFVDRGVPRRLRDGVPLIASGSGVLWTPFQASCCQGGRPYQITAARES